MQELLLKMSMAYFGIAEDKKKDFLQFLDDVATSKEPHVAPKDKKPRASIDLAPGKFCGMGKGEKEETFERLQSYRKENGVGSWNALAAASDGLSNSMIASMYEGGRYDISVWRKLSKALDKIGA